MKKIIMTFAAGLIAVCSYAQTAFDAYRLSENDYDGTARTMAMGNAFTALGGDLGSIGLNPAGSAVAGYSQITVTPGVTFAATTSQGILPFQGSTQTYFENKMKSSVTNFNLPNVGVTVNFKTNRTSGLKNWTIGFVMNQTADYTEDVYAKGTNSNTSFMGALAYDTQMSEVGLTGSYLGSENAFDYYEDWRSAIGYNSGMISTFGDYDDRFIGASETMIDDDSQLGGPIKQAYGRKVRGSKCDYVINFGANISDFVYFGANFGITSTEYTYTDYFKEEAMDPADFKITYNINHEDGTITQQDTWWSSMKYKSSYSASGLGYYGKFGVIITPGSGIRIGAAIQTPTINVISESFQDEGETTYTDSNFNAYSKTPNGEFRYRMVSPLRANFGLAYTFGKLGAVSADYELCNYGSMKYKPTEYDQDDFDGTNEVIDQDFRIQHMLRIGAEIKPVTGLSIRAGYGLMTSAEVGVSTLRRQNISFGLGYSTKKSFFIDLAAKRAFPAREYFLPYNDYIFDENGDVLENGFVPEIGIKKSLWKAVVTFGWRF